MLYDFGLSLIPADAMPMRYFCPHWGQEINIANGICKPSGFPVLGDINK
jgi:hypothetical protein